MDQLIEGVGRRLGKSRDDNSPRFTAPSGREVTFWDASEPFVELFFDHDDAEDDPGKLEFLARELVRLLIEEELI